MNIPELAIKLVFCFVTAGIPALQAQSFMGYSVEHGLAQSQVYSICQDREGFLWFGTYGGGASRFDGTVFKTYDVHDGLSNNAVYAIQKDAIGTLWFGTDNGVSSFDGLHFRAYPEMDGKIITEIYLAQDSALWFGYERGVCRFDGRTFTDFKCDTSWLPIHAITSWEEKLWLGTEGGGLYTLSNGHFQKMPSELSNGDKNVYSLLRDRTNTLWVGTASSGVIRLGADGSQNILNRKNGLAGNTVWTLLEDTEGRIWIGTHSGLNLWKSGLVRTFDKSDGLKSDDIWCLLEDNEHNIWFGTDVGGVVRYRDFGIEPFDRRNGLSAGDIWSIVDDERGSVWFGTSDGLARFHQNRFSMHPLVLDERSAIIYSVFQNSRKQLLVGTDGKGVYSFVNGTFTPVSGPAHLATNTVYSIGEDHNGNLWIATAENGICRRGDAGWTCFTKDDGLNDNCTFAIFEDRTGNIWCVTYRGVCVLKGKRFENPFNNDILNKSVTLSVAQDPAGALWFGTENGVFSYEGDSLSHLTEKDGLTSNIVYFLEVDSMGGLWIGHNRGIDRFDWKTFHTNGMRQFDHFGVEEGITGLECNQNAVAHDRRGRIWFGTVNGAYRFSPDFKTPTQLPETRILGIRLFMQETDLSRLADSVNTRTGLPTGLELPFDKNHVTIDFSGISFTTPGKTRYKFRLDGFDNEWSPVTRERYAVYANLPPGRYTFEVVARSGNGNWSPPATFSFVVLTPFWKTLWFYGLASVLVGLFILIFIRWRTHVVEQKSRQLEALNLKLHSEVDRSRQTEEALRSSELKFRSLAELVNASIFVVQGAQIIYTNPYASRFTGYSTEELSSMKFWEFTHPEQREMVQRMGTARQQGKSIPNRYELKILTKSGDSKWCEMLMNFVEYDGKPSILGAAIDITEQKETVEALKNSEERYRNLFMTSLVGMFKTSLQSGTVIEANPKAREIFGYDQAHLDASNLYVDPADRELMKRRLVADGFVENFETRMRRKSGEVIWVSFSAKFFPDDYCLEGVVVDITERKKAEDALLKIRKIESLGVLAGGIAHDFNNVLTAILGNISLAEINARNGDLNEVLTHLKHAEQASLHAKGLTKQLLTFSKGGEPVKQLTSVADLLGDVTSFALAGSNIRIQLTTPDKLRAVNMDRGQIGQVIQNLLLNSSQAMPDGGTIQVSAAEQQLESSTMPELAAGNYVVISVRDEGSGIKPENMPKIFDPYFTTKQHGSGLGLAMAYSILKNHLGTITVESEVGRGSTFHLFLPASDETPDETSPAKSMARSGKGLILLMDDEEAILHVLRTMLLQLGYDAITTRDASSAVQSFKRFRHDGKKFDAIILDLTIPGGPGGKDVARDILAMDKSARIIVSSGYSTDAVMSDPMSYGFTGILPKPYTLEDVARVVAQVVASNGESV